MTLKYGKKEASCLENTGLEEKHSRESPRFPYCPFMYSEKGAAEAANPQLSPKRKGLLPLAKALVKR